ncbi:MAG: hypothetical protein HDS82_00405 [Bacteroidales bacterium]|nr:hypothetical protein [Bacteroidales bacterium]
MKALSIISYVIGSILLIISCFTTGVTLTWWLGGISVAFLIAGCIFQFQTTKDTIMFPRHDTHSH